MKLWQSVQRCRRALSLENRADGGLRLYGTALALLIGALLLVLTLGEPTAVRGEPADSGAVTR